MKKISLFICAALLCTGMCFGATAGKGVFSVAANKTVQFANTVSVYNTNDLIQWAHLSDVTDAGWEVLTGAEWSYLLASGRAYAYDLNALGTVDGKNGLIILPDGWVQPDGVPAYRTVDEAGVGYEYNVYTAEEWTVMADAGAVFLPCGGYGYEDEQGYHVEDAEDHGAYWAADEHDATHANCLRFNLDNIHDLNYALKTNYYSVILVSPVPPTGLTVERMNVERMKVIRNGQVVIVHEGKAVNLLGQEIK